MATMLDPNGQPPVLMGQTWLSADGRYWWNGTAWLPVVKKRRQPPWILIGLALVIIAGVAYVIHAIPGPSDTTPYGVSNAKIDSPMQIEFDYRAKESCTRLYFDYVFYDSSGAQVDELQDEQSSSVTAGKSYHFTIDASGSQSIDPKATRFTATPSCHS